MGGGGELPPQTPNQFEVFVFFGGEGGRRGGLPPSPNPNPSSLETGVGGSLPRHRQCSQADSADPRRKTPLDHRKSRDPALKKAFNEHVAACTPHLTGWTAPVRNASGDRSGGTAHANSRFTCARLHRQRSCRG